MGEGQKYRDVLMTPAKTLPTRDALAGIPAQQKTRSCFTGLFFEVSKQFPWFKRSYLSDAGVYHAFTEMEEECGQAVWEGSGVFFNLTGRRNARMGSRNSSR